MVPIFLIWTSKLSKLGPKTCQDRPKRAPRWSQDGQVGANMEPRWHQDGQRCAKIGLREHQDGAKMAKLEPIWSQDGAKIAPRWPKMRQHRPTYASMLKYVEKPQKHYGFSRLWGAPGSPDPVNLDSKWTGKHNWTCELRVYNQLVACKKAVLPKR